MCLIVTVFVIITLYFATDSVLLRGTLLAIGTVVAASFILHKFATAIEHSLHDSPAEWFYHNSRSHNRRDDAQSGTD
jgi:hypothetical protein